MSITFSARLPIGEVLSSSDSVKPTTELLQVQKAHQAMRGALDQKADAGRNSSSNEKSDCCRHETTHAEAVKESDHAIANIAVGQIKRIRDRPEINQQRRMQHPDRWGVHPIAIRPPSDRVRATVEKCMKCSKPIRILIVEDNPEDEALILRQLKNAQLDDQVRVIADGNRALNYLTDAKYKCEDLIAVFLKLELPVEGGGIALLESIRGADRLKHLPVIVMSSSSGKEQLDKCHALGVSAYVSKPVSFSALMKAIADAFRYRKSSASTEDMMPDTA